MNDRPLHVLVIDDSAVVRQAVERRLRRQTGWRVTLASDGVMALERIRTDPPDVILLDLEMPRLDGLTFLKHLMATHPIPVVVCSAHAASGSNAERAALRAGARHVIAKPRLAVKTFLEGPDAELEDALRRAVGGRDGSFLPPPSAATADAGALAAATAGATDMEWVRSGRAPSGREPRVVLLGASMGGPAALRRILSAFPADGPACLVVQHMQGTFTRDFARRLDAGVEPIVLEAAGGEALLPGRVLVAPGDHHLIVARSDHGGVRVEVIGGELVQGHRPSVDVLFRSAAEVLGPRAVAALLTGMGRDGAEGLLALRHANAATFAQAPEGCTVYGMPGAAAELGAAERLVPLDALGSVLLAASGYGGPSAGRWSGEGRHERAEGPEVGSA